MSDYDHDHDHHGGGEAAFASAGADLCLAFANTRYWRGRADPTETLGNFGDVLAWLDTNAGLPADLLLAARNGMMDDSAGAVIELAAAIALRETIYRIFTSVAAREAVPEPDLATLNLALAAAPPRTRLARRGDGIGWSAPWPPSTPPILLGPVLWSAADLLTDAPNRRIRRCANDECLWLFMDHSKGGTRRWCDMNSCGNRAKSRRHYRRARGATT